MVRSIEFLKAKTRWDSGWFWNMSLRIMDMKGVVMWLPPPTQSRSSCYQILKS